MNLGKVLIRIEEAMIYLGYTTQDEYVKDARELLQEACDEITKK